VREATYRERTTQRVRDDYDRAKRLIRQRSLDEAAEILRVLVETEPDFAPACNLLGVIEIERGNRDAAFGWFQAALETDDMYAPALTNTGNMSLEAGRPAEARGYYNRAVDADQEYGPAHNSLGVLLRQEGRTTEAVRHLRIARRKGAYQVAYDSIESPRGRRSCLLIVGFIVTALAGAIILILRY